MGAESAPNLILLVALPAVDHRADDHVEQKHPKGDRQPEHQQRGDHVQPVPPHLQHRPESRLNAHSGARAETPGPRGTFRPAASSTSVPATRPGRLQDCSRVGDTGHRVAPGSLRSPPGQSTKCAPATTLKCLNAGAAKASKDNAAQRMASALAAVVTAAVIRHRYHHRCLPHHPSLQPERSCADRLASPPRPRPVRCRPGDQPPDSGSMWRSPRREHVRIRPAAIAASQQGNHMPWSFSLRSCYKAGAGRRWLVTGPAPWPALMLRSAGFSAFAVRFCGPS